MTIIEIFTTIAVTVIGALILVYLVNRALDSVKIWDEDAEEW